MEERVEPLLTRVADATDRLLATVGRLSDGDCRAASRLPSWTRGHVLSHLARNADALAGLMDGARTGRLAPMYASAGARDADIEAGAARPAADLVADLRTAAARFAEAAAGLGPAFDRDAWSVEQVWRHGRSRPTADVPLARLAEVDLHHVDLGAGYELADIPDPVAELLIDDAVSRLGAAGDVSPFQVRVEEGGPAVPAVDTAPAVDNRALGAHAVTVAGSRADLLGWLAGRTDGSALRCDGELPRLPAWG